jgi:hypothetical protein
VAYRIEFAQSVRAQIEALTAGQRKALLQAIEQHLTHEPQVETRNRKRLRPNRIAPWELRVGQLRAFYDVTAASAGEPGEPDAPTRRDEGVVQILAVGVKRGSELRIGGKRIDL